MGGMATGSEMNDVWYSSDGITWFEFKSTTGNVPASTRHAQSTTVYDNALWYMCGIASNNAWKIINTTTAGVAEHINSTVPTLSVYPNPAEELITISTIQVYDLFGYLVDQTNVTPIGQIASTTIDISSYASGVYVIQINTDPSLTAKFMKP
jgi:hypothetical protein